AYVGENGPIPAIARARLRKCLAEDLPIAAGRASLVTFPMPVHGLSLRLDVSEIGVRVGTRLSPDGRGKRRFSLDVAEFGACCTESFAVIAAHASLLISSGLVNFSCSAYTLNCEERSDGTSTDGWLPVGQGPLRDPPSTAIGLHVSLHRLSA